MMTACALCDVGSAHAVVGACQLQLVPWHQHTVGWISWQPLLKVGVIALHTSQWWQLHAVSNPASAKGLAQIVRVQHLIDDCQVLCKPAPATAAISSRTKQRCVHLAIREQLLPLYIIHTIKMNMIQL
jgi:hypothetical protein